LELLDDPKKCQFPPLSGIKIKKNEKSALRCCINTKISIFSARLGFRDVRESFFNYCLGQVKTLDTPQENPTTSRNCSIFQQDKRFLFFVKNEK
jgi:hypothetical protein